MATPWRVMSKLYLLALERKLAEHLAEHVPPHEWARTYDDSGVTLLHLAAGSGELGLVWALLRAGCDPNAASCDGNTPLHQAYDKPAVLRVLLQRPEVNVWAANLAGETALDRVVGCQCFDSLHTMQEQGVRLARVSAHLQRVITPAMRAHEQGVLRCRAVVVALLGLKRRRGPVLRDVDRWVVRFVALTCWATRGLRNWLPRHAVRAK